MTLTRNYLTGEELAVVVTELLSRENIVDREVLKVGLVAQILIEDLDEYDDNTDIYNVIMAQDEVDFDRDVKNYYMIDKIIDKEERVDKVVESFLKDIGTKAEESFKKLPKELKNVKIDDLLGQFKEVIDSGNNQTLVQ